MVTQGDVRSGELSRVTLVGERRRVDLVLPAHEPIGRLLPDLLQLLDDRVGAKPMLRHLVTASGTMLPQDTTLAAAGVPDGAVLRLVRASDAPSAPVVHDVSDETAQDLDLRAWRWRPQARRWTATVATPVLAVFAGLLAEASLGPATAGIGLLVFAALALVAGIPVAYLGNRALAASLLLTGGALGALGAWAMADAHGWPTALRWACTAGAVAVTLALLGRFSPLGRGGMIGAGAVALWTGLWEVVAALQGGAHSSAGQARMGAVMLVASLMLLGLLPRLALVTAGLTGLDDARAGGASVSRYQVGTALAAAHRGLALATIATAVSAAAAGWLAVSVPSAWTVALTVLGALVLAVRARAFPLVAEVVVLLLAAGLIVVRLLALWTAMDTSAVHWPLLVMCLLAVVPLVVLAVQPPEHVQARLRRTADVVEAFGVVVLVPLAVGAFGVYARLLGAFK